jgi:cytochrome c oxidase assembly protein subunit 15
MSEAYRGAGVVGRLLDRRTPSRAGYPAFAAVTTGLTFVLRLLGAYTSAIGAGLACPDWPRCYGTWMPFLQPEVLADSPYTGLQILAEWAHRGLAALVGLLILWTVVSAWRVHRGRPEVIWSATVAIVLLPVQVALGGLTVTRSLEPLIVTAHLVVAIIILVALSTTTLAAWLQRERGSDR